MTEVAAVAETGLMEPPEGGEANEERSLASDAWREMRRNPLFWVATALITIFVLMAIWPSLFTSTDPTDAVLAKSRERPNADAWFGRDIQGYDIYARCVYGARASILVGVMCTIGTVLIGGTIGVISGYQGGWADSLLSRIGDVFFAIPLLLGAIIFLVSLPELFNNNYFLIVLKVVLALVILVGVMCTIGTVLIGGTIGVISGYQGGWADSLLSRIGDVFFAIPLLLGAIIFLVSLPELFNNNYFLIVLKVVLALVILGWPSLARLMRSSVIQVKPNDYVQAARALGASPNRIVRSHVLPNSLAPVIVVATINLGAYIAAEATLSFLGIGLQPPAISWGIDISRAIVGLRTTPHMLFFPSLFLSLTVLAFIMLGDVVRDALDPKNR